MNYYVKMFKTEKDSKEWKQVTPLMLLTNREVQQEIEGAFHFHDDETDYPVFEIALENNQYEYWCYFVIDITCVLDKLKESEKDNYRSAYDDGYNAGYDKG